MSSSTHFQAFWSVGPFSEQYFTNVTSPLSSSSTGISSSVSDIQQRRSRPILPPFETEILVKDNVSLLDLKDQKTDYKNGTIVLTSHRILWYCTQSNRFLYSKVEDVKQIRISRNIFKKSNNIHIEERISNNTFKIALHSGGRDEFNQQSKYVLEKKSWERKPINYVEFYHSSSSSSSSSDPSSASKGGERGQTSSISQTSKEQEKDVYEFKLRGAGIGGIKKLIEEKERHTSQLADQAFLDLDHLMQKATEMVSVMSKYSEILANKKKQKATTESTSSSDEETKEAQQLEEMLLQIGISNPITKEAVGGDGGAYLREIAHEIVDFLSTDFNRNGLSLLMEKGGIMTLQDVYCMYNRARGTNLISPKDMVEACEIINSLNLSVELFVYKTGVKVLQSRNYSPSKIDQTILELIEKQEQMKDNDPIMTATKFYGFLTPIVVSQAMNVSAQIGLEFLLGAENRGKVVRDVSVQGLIFYKNLFC